MTFSFEEKIDKKVMIHEKKVKEIIKNGIIYDNYLKKNYDIV